MGKTNSEVSTLNKTENPELLISPESKRHFAITLKKLPEKKSEKTEKEGRYACSPRLRKYKSVPRHPSLPGY
jgi:hypothetical protein